MNGVHIFDCQACEAALCDYIDGTLAQEPRAALEAHLLQCGACTAYIREIREGVDALAAAEPVEPSPILVNRILYQIPQKERSWRGFLGRLFEPVLQPRVVMGAMMTVLSLAMMTRCAGVPSRSLTPSDLDPVKIWAALDNRMHRTWDRGVKAYESMRLVYEVRSRVHEWRQRQEEQDAAASEAAANAALKSKKVSAPVKEGK